MSGTPDLQVGDRGPARRVGPLTRTDIVRYAGASGDFTPLHHDEELARAAGFPTVFSMGMFQAGILATYAADWLGAEAVRRLSVRFEEQVWPGDTLECHGVVEDVLEEQGLELLLVRLRCDRLGGGTAVSGQARFVR